MLRLPNSKLTVKGSRSFLLLGAAVFFVIISAGLLVSQTLFQAQASVEPNHFISIPYYSIQGNWNSTLTLNNAEHDPLTVSVTLFSLNGYLLELAPVSLKPNSSAVLRLNEAIARSRSKSRGEFQEGNIKLGFYSANPMALGPQVTVSDPSHGLSFDMEPPMGLKSSFLEGLWWSLDEKTSGQVILTNTIDQKLDFQLDIQWQGGIFSKRIDSLSSHQTKVLDIAKLLEELRIDAKGIGQGGISITHNGTPGALIAHGVILNKERRFSSNLVFIDPSGQKTSVLNGTGLMLGNPGSGAGFPEGSFFTPHLVLKNTLRLSQEAKVTVVYKSGGSLQTRLLPAISLAPQEVNSIDFSALMRTLGKVSVDAAQIKIECSGGVGSLVASLSSIDRTQSLVVDVPLVSKPVNSGEGGNHPFRIDETFQSVACLTNITSKPTRAMLIICYDEGQYTPEYVNLEPGDSIAVDLTQLRDSQASDVQGRKLPKNLTEGQLFWVSRRAQAIIGRVIMFDRSSGKASNFSCPICCEVQHDHFAFSPSPFNGPIGGSQQMTVNEYNNWCGYSSIQYGPYNVTSVVDYSSDNTSIATVNTSGMVSFVSVGSTTIDVVMEVPRLEQGPDDCYWVEDMVGDSCPAQTISVNDVTANGATKITSVNGDQNIIHFVTPKDSSGTTVTLTATITPSDSTTLATIDWSGATENSSNPLQATVSKSAATKHIIQITSGGAVLKELRVWVVWAEITTTQVAILYHEPVAINAPGTDIGASIDGGYAFTHTIQPASIITDTNRPNFSGSKTTNPPGGNHPIFGDPLADGADMKWDNSRQIRAKIINPNNISDADRLQPPVPASGISYPSNEVEGNDDSTNEEETNDPYNADVLTGVDLASEGIKHTAGSNGNTFELRLHFKEFTRLEIEGTWHRISDYKLWRIHFKFKKVNGKWVNDSSIQALNNDDF